MIIGMKKGSERREKEREEEREKRDFTRRENSLQLLDLGEVVGGGWGGGGIIL